MKTARLWLAGALVFVAVVIGAVALLDDDSGGASEASGGAAETNAVALSTPELLAEVNRLGLPAYWIGPRAGIESYELSSTPGGQVYVRYLTSGADAGDPRAAYLTIGTYPVAEAPQALASAAQGANGTQTLTRHDGYQVLSGSESTNAYVAFRDQPDLQVEIFSPQAGEAAELAKSGALQPIR